jgi:hypothetical protein
MSRIVLAVVVAAAAAAALPTAAWAGSFQGVVVSHQGTALAVAQPSGHVTTVRSASHARVGARVSMSGTKLSVIGRASRAHVHGVLVRRVGNTAFLAAGRTVLALHGTRGLAGVVHTRPGPGAVVDATVTIGQSGTLTTQTATTGGQVGSVQVQAVVSAVGPGTVTLTVNGQQLTLPLPAGLALPATMVGQSVTLTLDLGSGTPSATPQGDDDENDDNDDNEDGGDHSGSGSGGSGGHDD